MSKHNYSSLLLALVMLVLTGPFLRAQSLEEGTGEIEHTGTEVQLDSALLGRDIFSALPEQVVVRQSPAVRSALTSRSPPTPARPSTASASGCSSRATARRATNPRR